MQKNFQTLQIIPFLNPVSKKFPSPKETGIISEKNWKRQSFSSLDSMVISGDEEKESENFGFYKERRLRKEPSTTLWQLCGEGGSTVLSRHWIPTLIRHLRNPNITEKQQSMGQGKQCVIFINF